MFNFKTPSGVKLTQASKDVVKTCLRIIPAHSRDKGEAERLIAMDVGEEINIGQLAVVIKAELIVYEEGIKHLGFVHPLLTEDMKYVQYCIVDFMEVHGIKEQSEFDKQINALYDLEKA